MSILLEINDFDEHEDTHPRGPDRKWMRERSEKGAFVTIFKDLELTDKEGFRRFMRMDIDHFKKLLATVGPDYELVLMKIIYVNLSMVTFHDIQPTSPGKQRI